MVDMYLYVEGGGDSKVLRTECRHGFSEFLKNAGFAGKLPRIVACGSRKNAYDSFATAMENGDPALLLIDSEATVTPANQSGEINTWKPWEHLKNRPGDNWERPDNAADDDCHLMVQCMESWFIADRETLKAFFGQDFNNNALPAIGNSFETIDKVQIYQSLANASRKCDAKGQYGKGKHSFKILALLDPAKVTAASKWAERFVKTAKVKMSVAMELER